MRVLFPIYPLAPEQTWRASRGAVVALVTAAAAHAPDGVVLGGDSAGGGYALSVAQGVRDSGGTPPTHLVLVSPWVDLTASAPGQPEAALTDPWLTLSRVNIYATWWAGSQEDRARPEASPGLGDLTGLPRTLRFCGTRDLLHPQNVLLSERARESGWDDTFVEGKGLIHVYPLLPIPEARAAHRRIVEFLRQEGADESARRERCRVRAMARRRREAAAARLDRRERSQRACWVKRSRA